MLTEICKLGHRILKSECSSWCELSFIDDHMKFHANKMILQSVIVQNILRKSRVYIKYIHITAVCL